MRPQRRTHGPAGQLVRRGTQRPEEAEEAFGGRRTPEAKREATHGARRGAAAAGRQSENDALPWCPPAAVCLISQRTAGSSLCPDEQQKVPHAGPAALRPTYAKQKPCAAPIARATRLRNNRSTKEWVAYPWGEDGAQKRGRGLFHGRTPGEAPTCAEGSLAIEDARRQTTRTDSRGGFPEALICDVVQQRTGREQEVSEMSRLGLANALLRLRCGAEKTAGAREPGGGAHRGGSCWGGALLWCCGSSHSESQRMQWAFRVRAGRRAGQAESAPASAETSGNASPDLARRRPSPLPDTSCASLPSANNTAAAAAAVAPHRRLSTGFDCRCACVKAIAAAAGRQGPTGLRAREDEGGKSHCRVPSYDIVSLSQLPPRFRCE